MMRQSQGSYPGDQILPFRLGEAFGACTFLSGQRTSSVLCRPEILFARRASIDT